MRTIRYIIAALASGTACWTPILLLAVHVAATDTGRDRLGEPDDAPLTAAHILFAISPIAISGLAILFAALCSALRRAHLESLRILLFFSALFAFVVGLAFGTKGLFVLGVADAVISFAVFGIGAFVSLAFGSTVWVFCTPRTFANNTLCQMLRSQRLLTKISLLTSFIHAGDLNDEAADDDRTNCAD